MQVFILDNYDSFTYNLVQLVEQIGVQKIVVQKNDELDFSKAKKFDKIILSPGAGLPMQAGDLMEFIKKFHATKSMLGVCLGHQAIAEFFGAKLYNLKQVKHGLAENVQIQNTENKLFAGLPENFAGGLYHSWAVSENNFPESLEITAKNLEGEIMAISHKKYDLHGIQFHPESIMTPLGKKIVENWLFR